MSPFAKKIYEIARAHNDRYLLPVRYRRARPWEEPTTLDREYSACDELVDGGYAHWLRTRKFPGIELTLKPITFEIRAKYD